MDSGVDAVTKGDVPCQFVQLSIDRERIGGSCVNRCDGTAIRSGLACAEPGALEQRLYRLAAIEEELQRCDAGTGNGSMASRVAWVGWTPFRECLRQQEAAELRVDEAQRRRIQDIRMQRGGCLGNWLRIGKVGLHQSSIFLRTHPQIDYPLVEPCAFQSTRRH